MDAVEIRQLCRNLRCAESDRQISDMERDQAAKTIETLLDMVYALERRNRKTAEQVMKLNATDNVRSRTITFDMTYADAATYKQVQDFAYDVFAD